MRKSKTPAGSPRYYGNFNAEKKGWCRGAELNCLRRPFQGRALPVSYPGTVGNVHFRQNSGSRKAKCAKTKKNSSRRSRYGTAAAARALLSFGPGIRPIGMGPECDNWM